ncbi:MAG: hypothetical protein JW999_06715 [Methanotrichaceae archaeon]|nr:hypothetical protein [Methanotrichaceae archaeon]
MKPTIRKNVRTIGTIARFNIVARRLFQCDEADRISEALSRAIRQMTLTTLISETPIVAKVLTTDVVLAALMVLVALIVLLTVLNIDDNIISLSI